MMLVEWGDKKILFLMATELEYGKHLKNVITPAFIGIGPIEASINTMAILAKLTTQGNLPDLIVSLGSAGSNTLPQTQIYQVSSVCWRDMDASAIGFEKGVTPFLNLPAILPMPCFLSNYDQATLSTGGNIISGHAYQNIASDMVDMETYAILRCCQHFGIELLGLRGISDGSNDVQHIDDWQQYLHIIDEKLAIAVESLKTTLQQQK